jgi:hypothetical protein
LKYGKEEKKKEEAAAYKLLIFTHKKNKKWFYAAHETNPIINNLYVSNHLHEKNNRVICNAMNLH